MPVTIDANSIEWVTLDEVKAHLNVTSASSNDELILVQRAAQGAVEGIIGPVLWRTVNYRANTGKTRFLLPITPVVSVTSALADGAEVTYSANLDLGLLYDVDLLYTPIDVVYVAGRTTVSDDIRYATLIIAAHLWETQRGNAPTPGFNEEAFGGTPGVGYAIPNRAMDLLAPHQLPTGIA